MAAYTYAGPGADIFDAFSAGRVKARLLYQNSDQFGLRNDDGSKSYFHGSGLVWDRATGHFTSGTITQVMHYSAHGRFIDELRGVNVAMKALDPVLHGRSSPGQDCGLRDLLMVGDDSLTGGSGNDRLTGGAGNDAIHGLEGNDILSGQAGDDSLHGGLGVDVLQGGTGADLLNGGAGNDWANYGNSTEGISASLLTGNGWAGDASGDRFYSIENLSGSAYADALNGNAAANALYGRGGSDVLNGNAGNDVLLGGTGADRLDGGDGFDFASYRDSAQGVSVNLETGVGAWGDAAGDQLFAIENLTGSDFYDLLTGNDDANQFTGNGGGDTLHGEGGDDRLDGGTGDDFITGGDGIDTILGGDGNDLIDAGTGRDIIKGGAGDDVIYGGPDPDVVIYDFAWENITADYHSTDYSIWVVAPDGTDHIFTALTIATTTGTYRYDVPTASWVHESSMTGNDWLGL